MEATPHGSYRQTGRHTAETISIAQHSTFLFLPHSAYLSRVARWAVLIFVPHSQTQVARAATSKQLTHTAEERRAMWVSHRQTGCCSPGLTHGVLPTPHGPELPLDDSQRGAGAGSASHCVHRPGAARALHNSTEGRAVTGGLSVFAHVPVGPSLGPACGLSFQVHFHSSPLCCSRCFQNYYIFRSSASLSFFFFFFTQIYHRTKEHPEHTF